MTPERWRQIEELYQAAQKDRAALDRADPDLRREVEALLAGSGESTVTMLAAGMKLGPYEIEGPLGAGGMGEVFKARDTRLGRAVAIKISNEQFGERFEREARAISALNHPHICTLYDVGPNYLVMELVEGETLAARLKKGPLPIDLVLRYGAQIADALAAAHARGIVHRDLKPGNVMLTKSGVKVLDFGLAKSPQDETLTASRVVMGTPAYMAPEQREGKECDARSDIYALGLVLTEMATGKRAVAGQRAPLPEKLAPVIERCLAEDPEDRWQAAKDVKAVLEWAGQSAPQVTAGTESKAPARWMRVAAVLVCGGLLLAGVLFFRRSTQPELPVRLTLSFDGLIGEAGVFPAPSPDGRNFVFLAFDSSGKGSLWLRPLDSGTARPLPGTDDAHQPFWSPDGRWVGFYSQGKLKRVSPSGGNPQTIAELRSLSGAGSPAWSSGGDIVFAFTNRGPLFRIAEAGGPPKPLTQLDRGRAENSHRYPVFLPDGRRFLFLARSGQRENNALYLGSLDSGEVRRVVTIQSNVSYLPPLDGRGGAILYVRDGALVEQTFDGEKVSGEPAAIVDKLAYSAASVLGEFAASNNGRVLIFRPAAAGSTYLRWYDHKGTALGALGPPGDYSQPRFSPDGARVLYSRPDEETGNRDLWYIETSRGVAARLTTSPANDWWAAWSPDGRKIIFGSDRGGGPANEGYLKSSMEPGSGERQFLDFQGSEAVPSDWSPSGKWIAFTRPLTGQRDDVWISPAAGEGKPFAFLATPFDEIIPRFSPDEKWIAYVSDESGRYEVYARPFTGGPADPTGKLQISSNGGDFPVWQRDGRELFFIGGDLKLYSVKAADLGRPGVVPQPTALFTPCSDTGLAGLPMRGTPWVHPYDVSVDGQRFLFNCSILGPGRFDVLLNWWSRGR